jgi:DNA invertase Pin-like site-specific DNA recombinase
VIIGYARVSTEEQNLSMQLDALNKAGCERTYQEKISTTKANRPRLEEMLSYLNKGDILVVWKLDRLGRSLKDLIQLITQLAEKKVEFKSLNESIDTSTPVGKLTFHIFCALAEFEREIIRQRVTEGLQAARARKKTLGRPKGLTKSAQQKAFTVGALYKEGTLTPAQICKQINISIPTLYRYLRHQNIPLRIVRRGFDARFTLLPLHLAISAYLLPLT